MTYYEFFQELGLAVREDGVKFDWYNYPIPLHRTPSTAFMGIFEVVYARVFSVSPQYLKHHAAQRLGLTKDQYITLKSAAWHKPDHDPRVRARVLRACKLEEVF